MSYANLEGDDLLPKGPNRYSSSICECSYIYMSFKCTPLVDARSKSSTLSYPTHTFLVYRGEFDFFQAVIVVYITSDSVIRIPLTIGHHKKTQIAPSELEISKNSLAL